MHVLLQRQEKVPGVCYMERTGGTQAFWYVLIALNSTS